MRKKNTREYFERLRELVRCLKPWERQIALRYVVAFDRSVSRRSKALKLLRLLLKKPDADYEKVLNAISSGETQRALKNVVIRLTDKVQESLFLGINVNKKDGYSDYSKNYFYVRKKLMLASILRPRGLDFYALKLYDEVIEKSKKYELFHELVEALWWKKWAGGLRRGKKEFNKNKEEIRFYTDCTEKIVKSYDLYFSHFIKNVDFKGVNHTEIIFLRNAINQLKEDYRISRSATIALHLYMLSAEYYLFTGQYRLSCETSLKLVKHIRNSPAVYMKRRLGHALSDLADNEQYIYEFESSANHAREAQKLYNPGEYDFAVAEEVEVRSLFYMGEMNAALRVVNGLIAKTNPAVTPFHYGRRLYLKACVLFMLSRFGDSYLLLNQIGEITGDLEGWNLGIRHLCILTLIERELLDQASFQIEALRKYHKRTLGNFLVRPRDHIICRVFMALDKFSYDFAAACYHCAGEIEKLRQPEKGYQWEVKTPEMIVFHHWLEDKVNKKPYHFRVPEELLTSSSQIKEIPVV